MDELILRAEPRTIHGKQVSRLRRAGRLPGVVYGPAVAGTVSVTVDRKQFDRFFRNYGYQTIFTLEWPGDRRKVQIRDVQIDPVRHDSLHVDFYAPALPEQPAVPQPTKPKPPKDNPLAPAPTRR